MVALHGQAGGEQPNELDQFLASISASEFGDIAGGIDDWPSVEGFGGFAWRVTLRCKTCCYEQQGDRGEVATSTPCDSVSDSSTLPLGKGKGSRRAELGQRTEHWRDVRRGRAVSHPFSLPR